MCHWLASRVAPVRLEDALYRARPLPDRPEPALAPRRRDDQRQQVRHRLVRRRAHACRFPQRRPRLEQTPNLRDLSRPRRPRRCFLAHSGPRPARPSSGQTATRSATTAGCGSPTARQRLPAVERDLVLEGRPSLYPSIAGCETPRSSSSRAHPRLEDNRPPPWPARSARQGRRASAGASTSLPGHLATTTASACRCSATASEGGAGRCA